MGYRTYNLDTIIHAIPQTINFMTFGMCRISMKLALEDGLADLKEFTDSHSFTGIEYLLNGLCDLDLLGHVPGTVLAQKFFDLNSDADGETYSEVIFDVHWMYGNLMMIVFLLGLLYTEGGLDLKDDRNYEVLNMNFLCGNLDVLALLDLTDKNMVMLYDLIVTLDDLMRILFERVVATKPLRF